MGTLYIVATPIGNLSDMSYRGVEILKSVKYTAAEDTRHVIPLFKRYGIESSLISLHKFNETEKSGFVLDKIEKEDCDIALISDAGTPCISDPGAVLVALARKRKIKVVGIPGASAVTLAISISGSDVKNFAFLGFFPKDTKGKKEFIELMKTARIGAFVIYESPLRIVRTVKYLKECFPNAFGIVANDLTKLFESTLSGLFSEILPALESNQNVEKGEYVLVVEPRHKSIESEQKISLEALIVNEMAAKNITMKEAVKSLSASAKLNRNDIYQASLRLKGLMGRN